jgi:hypothetical protein
MKRGAERGDGAPASDEPGGVQGTPPLSEDALRTMIREAVAKRLDRAETDPQPTQHLAFASHASHFRYALPGSGGPCLIEPGVQCNHCGYCESHGH